MTDASILVREDGQYVKLYIYICVRLTCLILWGILFDCDYFLGVIGVTACLMVDGAPVWHFVSRRGAGCCLKTPEIQTKWPRRCLYCSYQLDSNFHLLIFS